MSLKILVASDKFKGSLTQQEANETLYRSLSETFPEAKVKTYTLSDGGDGFLLAVGAAIPDAEKVFAQVTDPLGREITAYYLWIPESGSAYIEMAQASGLSLLKPEEKDVLNASSTGTGALIKHAAERGAKKIYVGLGGSATNDAGMGIAHAFGYRFLDKEGVILEPSGNTLEKVWHILVPDRKWPDLQVYAVHDVFNVLYGPHGAASVYGPQKGGDPVVIAQLDHGLKHFDHVVSREYGHNVASVKGSGAAGGAAYGLKVFLGATYLHGVSFMLETLGLSSKINDRYYDLIVSGEGKVDDQTVHGKLLFGLGVRAKASGTPLVAFCGENTLDKKRAAALGISEVVVINDIKRSLRWNLDHAQQRLYHMAGNYFQDHHFCDE